MKVHLLLLAIVALLVAGCGGSRRLSLLDDSPFEGQFSGTWEAPAAETTGTANITILPNGTITGTAQRNGSNDVGTINGQIANNGTVTGTVQFPEETLSTVNGTWGFNAENQLVGDLTQTVGTQSFVVSYTLDRVNND